MPLARKQFKVRMDSLSFSLEGRGSTETLEEDKELSLAQLEEKDTKTEAVAGRSVDNIYGKTGAVQLVRAGSDKKACDYDTLAEDQEYIKEIKELHAYLDTQLR